MSFENKDKDYKPAKDLFWLICKLNLILKLEFSLKL